MSQIPWGITRSYDALTTFWFKKLFTINAAMASKKFEPESHAYVPPIKVYAFSPFFFFNQTLSQTKTQIIHI